MASIRQVRAASENALSLGIEIGGHFPHRDSKGTLIWGNAPTVTQTDIDLADVDIRKWRPDMQANAKAVSNWRQWAAIIRLTPALKDADFGILITKKDATKVADEWDRLGFTVRRPAAKPVPAPAPVPTPAPVAAPAVPGLTPTEAMLLQALQGLKAKGLI